MFSKENLIKAGGTLLIVLAALAIHQKFVSPLLVAKPKPAVKA